MKIKIKKYYINIFIVVFSFIISLLICEIIVRLFSPYSFYSKYYPTYLIKSELYTSQPQKYDEELGYRYEKNKYFASHQNFGNKIFSTYNDGVRSNISKKLIYFQESEFKQPEFNRDNAIIITGDSFTAGSEVGNDQAMPAKLEELSGYRVLNGGVGGYSFTQSVLFAKDLINQKKIQYLIISLIPEDLVRSEYSIYQGVPRPYFISNNSTFTLEKNHIRNYKDFYLDQIKSNKILLKIISRSFLLMETIKRIKIFPELFNPNFFEKKESIRFDLIGCELVKQIKDFSNLKKINTAILIQYPDYHFYEKEKYQQDYINRYLENFKICINKNNLLLIDTEKNLNQIFFEDINKFNKLYLGPGRHMSEYGNTVIAEFILKVINTIWFKD